MKTMLKAGLLTVAGIMLLALPGNADAHRGRWKRHRGKRGCMKMLMRAPSWALKKRAGLNNAQIAKLKVIRTNFKKSIIPLRAQIRLLRVDMKDLMDNENVDQGKVLALVQKIHALKGKAKLLRVKMKLSVRSLLTPGQRMKLRKKCRRMRRFRRFRRFRRYGMRGPHRRWAKRRWRMKRRWMKRRWMKRQWRKRQWKKRFNKDDSDFETPGSQPTGKKAL